MRKASLVCSVLLLLFAVPLTAQKGDDSQPGVKASDQPAHFYRLQFVVQELNEQGKPINTRTFNTTVSTDSQESARIRSGSRLPIAVSSYQSGEENKGLRNTQYQFMDIGVNFDIARVRELGRQLSLSLHADVSSLAPRAETDLQQPIVRQNKWESNVLVPTGKPTVVFSSDTLESKGSIQVVITATPLQ